MIDLQEINDIKYELNKKVEKITRDCKDLKKITQDLEFSCKQYDSAALKRNPYIVKRVIKHIANGMCKHEAILLTANELCEPTKRVETLFWQQKAYMSALHLFSRKYTCEKMKAAGYTAKQIGKVIGVSENHIYKLLKAVPNEWLLDNF